jgi:hypothetical protein
MYNDVFTEVFMYVEEDRKSVELVKSHVSIYIPFKISVNNIRIPLFVRDSTWRNTKNTNAKVVIDIGTVNTCVSM